MVTKKPTDAELQAKKDYWLGKYRFIYREGSEVRVLPEYMGTPYYSDERLERQICVDIDQSTLKPKWAIAPDAPAPRKFDGLRANSKPLDSNVENITVSPPFDYTPAPWESDTQSGGPANFHGYAGGRDNPRNPETEGEVPGDREARLAQFKQLLAENAADATT